MSDAASNIFITSAGVEEEGTKSKQAQREALIRKVLKSAKKEERAANKT